MHRSTLYWVQSTYRSNEDRIARDAQPAEDLSGSVADLRRRWGKNFARAADKLAKYFAQSVENRSSAALAKILRDAGITVKFKMTRAMQDILQATVKANVSLIKSIPDQYFTQVEGIVMRSVQTGRDLGQLSKDLQQRLGVTKRRAALIARTQNNMATAAFKQVRYLEVGIEQADWHHSTAGKEPRPAHVQASRDHVRYNVATGWYDPHERKFVQPGELIHCRCFDTPVLPAMGGH